MRPCGGDVTTPAAPHPFPLLTSALFDYRAPMDTTPPYEDDSQHTVEEMVSPYSGETWRVVKNPRAGTGDLNDEDTAMVHDVMERAERAAENMRDPRQP